MRLFNILFVFVIGAVACSPQPQPISYGKAGCEFCKMTIVDERYASQLVTDKGKAFNFDAVECMINYFNENSTTYAFQLVTDFNNPTNLINAKEAVYLRTANLPSPMGMYITAVNSIDNANAMSTEHGGEIYNWDNLISKFEQLPKLQDHHGGTSP